MVDVAAFGSSDGVRVGGTRAQDAWETTLTAGRTAFAQMLASICSSMIQIAAEHVAQREQFGRSIGSYQAVQHSLALAHVATEAAQRGVDVAWVEQTAWSAQVAKALAGRAHDTVSRVTQQITGGMGMSWEFPLHHYVRRGAVFNAMLGTAAAQTSDLGRSLVIGRPS
nr:acyl-CoA dehydrogenase family protein [Aeromicrobium wangtongii]